LPLSTLAGYLPEPKTTIEEINRMLAAQSFEEQARAEQLAAQQQQVRLSRITALLIARLPFSFLRSIC